MSPLQQQCIIQDILPSSHAFCTHLFAYFHVFSLVKWPMYSKDKFFSVANVMVCKHGKTGGEARGCFLGAAVACTSVTGVCKRITVRGESQEL